ncbi:hypothetical protein BIY24_09805 [Halobacteriovorax marinus]|nr:hypothetical protein BIY24_09805 [Halobacteriovorax marinus]
MKRVKRLFLLFFLFASPTWSMEDTSLIGLVESSLDSLNKPFRVQCGQRVLEERSCPYMAKQFEHDSETGLFFWMLSDSPWQSCKKTVPSINSISSAELERSLANRSARDLGLKEDYFQKSLSMCFDTNYKNREQVESQKKVAVAMSYNYLHKIGDNTQKLSNEMIQINSILGRNLDLDLPCAEYNLPKNSYLCEELKKKACKPQMGLGELSEHLYEDAIAPIIAISKKIKEVRSKYRGRGAVALRTKKVNELKASVHFLKGEYPLLQGDKLSEHIENILDGEETSASTFRSHLKEQLISNKRALREKIKSNISIGNCILYGDSGNCDEFEEKFREIPYQSTPYQFNREELSAGPQSRMRQLAREELYQLPECLDRSRNLKNDFNSFAAQTSLNIGLTVVTGGAALAVRAGQLGRIALASRAAAIGADSAYFVNSIDNSIETCNEELNKLEQVSESDQNFSCPSKSLNDSPHYLKKRNMKACVTASLLSGLDALPFLPALSGPIARAINNPYIPKSSFKATSAEEEVLSSALFKSCINNRSSKKCKDFSLEHSNTIEGIHRKCLDPKVLASHKELCVGVEIFANNNSVYKLSDMVPSELRGKSVVVEFNSGRGHITLRYFKEVEENGEKIMKAFSFDGPSWLFPRRVNGRTLASNKKADSFESLDNYVPGSHYLIDITPAQLETIHNVAKKGGFSKACTHDARVALDEAGVLSMPKGVSKTFDKITIKKLAKDLSEKYGPPNHSTIRALEGGLSDATGGFSKEQWNTFAVTEFGWLVLTPTVVGAVYPAAGAVATMSTIVIVDQAGETIAMSKEKYNELIEELKSM